MNRKFFENISWIMVGRVIQLGLAFITTMLITRYLGPSEYGRLTYVFSYIQLFLPICALGMNDILVKTILDNKEKSDEIMGTIITMRIIVSAISMICSVCLVMIINNEAQYRTIAILQSLYLLFYSFDNIMYFYQANLLHKKVGIVLSVSYILSSIFKILGIYLNKNILWFALGMSLDYIILGILLLFVYYKDGHKLVFSKDLVPVLLNKSFYYIVSGLLVVIYGKVTDILLLGKLVDETNVGYYGVAIMLCNAWPFVLSAIIDTANPIIIGIHKSDKETFYKRVKQLYCAIFYISMFVSVVVFFIGDYLIYFLYGEQYLPAIIPLKIYSLSTAFSYLGVARTAWMQCENKTKYELHISIFGAIVNIILNYIMIKKYGINGAAITAVITQFLCNFVFLFVMKDTRENAKLILDAILLKGVFNKEDSPNVQE